MLIVHILYSVSYVVSPCRPEHISDNARRSCIFLKFVHIVFRWFNRIWIGVLYVIDLLRYHVKRVLTNFFQVAYIYVSLWCHFRIIHSKESDNECVCFNYVSQTLQGATDNILLFIPLLAKKALSTAVWCVYKPELCQGCENTVSFICSKSASSRKHLGKAVGWVIEDIRCAVT